MSARAVLLAAIAALGLLLPLAPAGAQQQPSGADFELDLDRSTFFELAGRPLVLGFTAFNFQSATAEFRLECAGAGLSVPPAQTVNITGGGRFEGNFSVAAPGPGEYDLTVTMKLGQRSARGLAAAIFLPPLSCKFVRPAANERIGVVGVDQPYTGQVNFTSFGAAPVQPTFSLPARDLQGGQAGPGGEAVTLQVGEVPAGATRLFTYNGSSLSSLGTRNIAPVVRIGGLTALYGYDLAASGVINVTRFEFTLAARELLGVELSDDRFDLGEEAVVIMYVESRRFGGIAGGRLDISLRSDLEARSELSDYAAEPRFEEFVELVESKVEFDRHFGLPRMEAGVQELYTFHFTPRICRAHGAGGSFFLDFQADLGGVPGSASRPVSVLSPLEMTLEAPEKVSYANTNDQLTRRMTVRNLSNATISGASACLFLDFRERGFLKKSDIAEAPAVPLPALGPGESAGVTLSVVFRSPGTYALFPMVCWGGLSVYGSHIQVVASAPGGTPIGPYLTAILVMIIPAALTRRLAPS